MHSHWSLIDTLVHDIGELAADVHIAERTLATDQRTHAARTALDAATDAVCTAIEDLTETAETRAKSAVAQARAAVAGLGLTIQTSRDLVTAARTLVKRTERKAARAAELRRRVGRPRPHR